MSDAAVIAIAAHPDDIEFVMAGTLLLLGEAGWEIHYLNLSTGNLGSTMMTPAETARVRRARSAGRGEGARRELACADLRRPRDLLR